mgnify:CR=1 FL=1
MAALEATIHVQGPKGARAIPIGDFHLLPGSTPNRETVLEPGDLVTHVTLPPPVTGSRQVYLKAARPRVLRVRPGVGGRRDHDRGRESDSGTASHWAAWGPSHGDLPRPKPRSSASLSDQANFRKAAEAAMRDAKPQSENGFKIELAKRCLTHALQMADSVIPLKERTWQRHKKSPTFHRSVVTRLAWMARAK